MIVFLLYALAVSGFHSPAGGNDALTVYIVGEPVTTTPAPTPETAVGYGEIGCVEDLTTGDRVRESDRDTGQETTIARVQHTPTIQRRRRT